MSGMAFQNLRDGFQGGVADSVLATIFLLPVFGVIFFYDATLGVIALGFSICIVLGHPLPLDCASFRLMGRC